MAMVLRIRYPGGETVWSIGYSVPGAIVRVDQVPRGPEACYGDEVEADFTAPAPYPVLRIVGGPRRPTIRVRLADPSGNELAEADREAWMAAREAEGWLTNDADDGSTDIWIVATRDDLDARELARSGATLLEN